MSNVSDVLVKAGKALGQVMAMIIALPAATATALLEGEWRTKAESILTAVVAIGRAFAEAVVKEAPGLVRLLAEGDTDAATAVLLKLWQVLKEGGSKQDTMLSE